MTTDPLPGTPAHTVLMHEAFADHQVANVTTGRSRDRRVRRLALRALTV